jgi:tungstate transport system ATP-binding protein
VTPLYRLDGVVQKYGERTVLSIDDLQIQEGRIIGLVGHNGSGKSTLLRLLAFLEDPVRGRVHYLGKACTTRQAWVRRQVTLLPQEPYLLKRSVASNVGYGLKVRGEDPSHRRVADVLEMVGLGPADFSRRPWHALSGGEAQRVALAARLILKPRVLLLDEPTTSLDEESTKRIQQASLGARTNWGTTLVVASHDTPWLDSVCDRILKVAKGEVTGV